MYNVSENFNTLASSNNRTVSCKVLINGTEIDPELIVSLNFKEASSSGSNISLGEAISNVIELKIYNTDIQLKGAEIKPYISFDGKESCPLGVFYASEINKDKTYINITAYDKMALLNEKYVPTVTFPCTLSKVMMDIAKQYGFTYSNSEFLYLTIENYNIECTVREMIGYIAGMGGTNAKFNRDGKLEFKFYKDTSITLEDEVFLDGQSDTSEDVYVISALVSGSGDNELKIGTGKAITFANPFITNDHLSYIYNKYLPFSYNAAKVKYRGNPAIEIGDLIYVNDVDGNSYKIPVMSQKFEFNGGLSATIESYGISDEMDVISNFKPENVEFNRRITTLEQMQNKILGSDGGYYEVLLDKNDNNRPYGTAWWKDLSKTQGWKFTYGGLGYFNNNTLQHIGITNDGDIVANNIASNGLITNSFTIGKADSDNTNYAMKFDGNTGKITFGSGVTISWSDIKDTPTNIATTDDIPTKLSQLANDTGFATTGDIPINISQLANDAGFQNYAGVVQISKDTIDAPFIRALKLKVGTDIEMGDNAVIKWSNISDSPTIPTAVTDLSGSDNLATKDEIPTTEEIVSNLQVSPGFNGLVTTITADSISTANITANQITAGKITAEVEASNLKVTGTSTLGGFSIAGDNIVKAVRKNGIEQEVLTLNGSDTYPAIHCITQGNSSTDDTRVASLGWYYDGMYDQYIHGIQVRTETYNEGNSQVNLDTGLRIMYEPDAATGGSTQSVNMGTAGITATVDNYSLNGSPILTTSNAANLYAPLEHSHAIKSKFKISTEIKDGLETAANTTASSTTFTIREPGYYPLGIVGQYMTGTNFMYVNLFEHYLSSQSNGSGKITFRYRNNSTAKFTGAIYFNVLWVSTT